MVRTIYCCVPGCEMNSENNPDLAYHYMPRPDQLRKEWLTSIGTPELFVKPFHTLKALRVCSKHFTINQYQFPGSKNLNFGAVPHIFEPLTLPARLSALLRETTHNAEDTPTIDLPEASGVSVALDSPISSHLPENLPTTHAEDTNNIAELRQLLIFKDSVTDCIESNTIEFDNEIVITTDEPQVYQGLQDNPDSDDCAEDTAEELTTEQLSKIIEMVEKVSDHIMEVDPNIARGLTIRRTINNAIRCYREMYETKQVRKK